MQTFLPHADFMRCASILDDKRLWKQVLEAKQILATLRGDSKAWANHPAVAMWRGYENELTGYLKTHVDEWLIRRLGGIATLQDYYVGDTGDHKPLWLGDYRLHTSHRSNLLRKDREYYSRFGWTEPDDLPYFWPTQGGY